MALDLVKTPQKQEGRGQTFSFSFSAVLDLEPRASYMPGKCSPNELYSSTERRHFQTHRSLVSQFLVCICRQKCFGPNGKPYNTRETGAQWNRSMRMYKSLLFLSLIFSKNISNQNNSAL